MKNSADVLVLQFDATHTPAPKSPRESGIELGLLVPLLARFKAEHVEVMRVSSASRPHFATVSSCAYLFSNCATVATSGPSDSDWSKAFALGPA